MEPGVIAIIIVGMVTLSPAVMMKIVLSHRERMTRLKQQQDAAPPGVAEAVASLRREVADLRDTTTHYDMAFDAALHRVEQRMNTLETPTESTDTYATRPYDNTEETVAVLRRG